MTQEKTQANRPTARKPVAAAVVTGVAIVVLVFVALIYASPYLVLSRVRDAVQQRDAQMIDRYVDYPALRASLKQQVTQMLSRRVQTQKLQHPFAALGALVGMALGKEVFSSHSMAELRRLMPAQNRSAARNIAEVCREVLKLPSAKRSAAAEAAE